MRKVLLAGMVLVLCLLTQGPTSQDAVAQGKKEVKKPAEGVIEITEGKDGKFRFFVRDGEGKLLAMSSPGGFGTTKDAQTAVDKLKEVISKAKVTTPKKDTKEKK